MPTLCRAYATEPDAGAAVDRLLAAGGARTDIRVLTGEALRDSREDPTGDFAGVAAGGVGSYAGTRSAAEGMGTFAGDADAQRRGGFSDVDRETVTDYRAGVRRVRVASHHDLRRLLVDAGLDEA